MNWFAIQTSTSSSMLTTGPQHEEAVLLSDRRGEDPCTASGHLTPDSKTLG